LPVVVAGLAVAAQRLAGAVDSVAVERCTKQLGATARAAVAGDQTRLTELLASDAAHVGIAHEPGLTVVADDLRRVGTRRPLATGGDAWLAGVIKAAEARVAVAPRCAADVVAHAAVDVAVVQRAAEFLGQRRIAELRLDARPRAAVEIPKAREQLIHAGLIKLEIGRFGGVERPHDAGLLLGLARVGIGMHRVTAERRAVA